GQEFESARVHKYDLTAPTTRLPSLHVYDCSDGGYPFTGLIQDSAGNLYGTTNGGGVFGYGTVYKLKPNGDDFTVLYSFNYSDGAYPTAGLIQDSAGNLYGTTYAGGTAGSGTVYKLDGATGD